MALLKTCKHARGLSGAEKDRAWRGCGCQWTWSAYVDGERVWVSVGADLREARARAAQLEADRLNARFRPAQADQRLEAVVDRLCDQKRLTGRRAQSIRTFRSNCAAALAWFGADAPVERIGHDDIADFARGVRARYTPGGAAQKLGALHQVLGHAAGEGIIGVVPWPRLPSVQQAARSRAMMSEAEVERTVAQLAGIWREAAEFVILTGLRIGEVLALRWEDVDLRAGALHVQRNAEVYGSLDAPVKTRHGDRRIRLDPAALELLRGRPQDDERVFPRRYSAAYNAFRCAMERAGTYGPQRGWHSLRHLNSALRDRAGQRLRSAAAELGHGPRFVQTAAYGWGAEMDEAAGVDSVRQRGTSRAADEGTSTVPDAAPAPAAATRGRPRGSRDRRAGAPAPRA